MWSFGETPIDYFLLSIDFSSFLFAFADCAAPGDIWTAVIFIWLEIREWDLAGIVCTVWESGLMLN